jgi:Sec-independent protein translocase protein TatA
MVATIALIVFGPEKLPQIARTIGRSASELRRMATDVKEEFQAGLDVEDEEPKKLSRRPHPNELATPAAPTAEAKGDPVESTAEAKGDPVESTAEAKGDPVESTAEAKDEADPLHAPEGDHAGEVTPIEGRSDSDR